MVGAFKQWQRARSEKLRCDEAVSKLCAEFRFARDGYAWIANAWRKAADVVGAPRGQRAYAYAHERMWLQKREEIVQVYEHERRKGVKSEELDHSRVSAVVGT